MKIALVIPDRKGRESFEKWWRGLIDQQVKDYLDIIVIQVNEDIATEGKTDLALRCQLGVSNAISQGCELIFFWENDDYYPSYYVATMANAWLANGKPNAIGSDHTTYVHVEGGGIFMQQHKGRSSLFHTAVSADFMRSFDWGAGLAKCPFLDLEVWKQAETKHFIEPIAIGLKHGIGYAGGRSHDPKWSLYKPMPKGWLLEQLGSKNLDLYKSIVC